MCQSGHPSARGRGTNARDVSPGPLRFGAVHRARVSARSPPRVRRRSRGDSRALGVRSRALGRDARVASRSDAYRNPRRGVRSRRGGGGLRPRGSRSASRVYVRRPARVRARLSRRRRHQRPRVLPRRARRQRDPRATRPPRPEPLPPRRRRRSRRALPRVRVRRGQPRRRRARPPPRRPRPLAGDDASSPASALSRVVVVGVSCGFSAAYVAEALERALDDGEGLFRGARVDVTCVGFNHPSSARPDFHRVMTALHGSARGERVLINPILGPEAIAGSTRMKGGTATKLVLDAAFAAAAVSACASRPNPHGAQSRVRATIDRLVRRASPRRGGDRGGVRVRRRDERRGFGRHHDEGGVVCRARRTRALRRRESRRIERRRRRRRRARELEAREPESASRRSRAPSHVACLGAVDAAEQYPTFGTTPERFRGWGGDGWAASAGVSDSEFSYDAFVSRRRDPDVPEVAVALFECPRKGTNAREAKAETNGTETETMFAGTTCVGRVCARADPDAYDAPPWASSGRPGDVFIDVPWEAEETETETETDGTEADGTEAEDADGTEAEDADGTEAKDANAREDTTFREIFAPRVAELAMKHAVNAAPPARTSSWARRSTGA